MTQPDGIDMARSGWTNPEGFQRAPRPAVAVPQAEACEAPGPYGWVCDLRPGHGGDHRADDGSPDGLRWVQRYADVSTLSDPPDEPKMIPARIEVVAPGSTLEEIAKIAQTALDEGNPSRWVLALDRILDLAKG